MKSVPFLFIAILTLATPAFAQQAPAPSIDPAKLETGDYQMDPTHARVIFSYKHMGYSTSYGLFTQATAKLNFDPKAPAKSSLEVSVDMNGIDTTVALLDEHLKGDKFFDVAKFPTATFHSTAIKVTGKDKGILTGDLTLHGVTKPVTLNVTFNGGSMNPMAKVFTLGFDAVGHVKRSDFGVDAAIPFVGDDITLTISAEFRKAG